MTARQIEVDADTLEAVAHRHGLNIELAPDRAYLTLDGITFTARLAAAYHELTAVKSA